MDINDLRSITTVVMLTVFVGIAWWAFSGRQKTAFDEAAQLPLAEDDEPTLDVEADAAQVTRTNRGN